MFKNNNKDNWTTSGVVLVFLLLTFNIFPPGFSVSIVNFEQVYVGWDEDNFENVSWTQVKKVAFFSTVFIERCF